MLWIALAACALAGVLYFDLQVLAHWIASASGHVLDPEVDGRFGSYAISAGLHALAALLLAPLVFVGGRRFGPGSSPRPRQVVRGTALALFPLTAVGLVTTINARLLIDRVGMDLASISISVLVMTLIAMATLPLARADWGRAGRGLLILWGMLALAVPVRIACGLNGAPGGFHGTKDEAPPPDLLLVTIDTLSADHLGCYGAAHGATPTLDSLATAGVVFENAYAQIPITLPAHTTLLTGTRPLTHGIDYNGFRRLGERLDTLAEMLRNEGLACAAFVSAAPLESRYGLDRGFELYHDRFRGERRASWRRALLTGVCARMLTVQVLLDRIGLAPKALLERSARTTIHEVGAWLEGGGGARFAWVHLFDPHAPHTPPADLAPRFRSEIAGNAIEEAAEGGDSPPLRRSSEDPSGFDADLYVAEVAAVDRALGALFASWRQTAGGRSSIVTVVADHGEHLGEHGYYGHSQSLFEPALRIPWIVSAPGTVPAGRRVAQPVQQLDFLPTLLELLGLPAHPSAEGRSLAPLMDGGAIADLPILLQAQGPDGRRLGVRHGRWKLIADWPKEHDEPVALWLYDLVNDPSELRNQGRARPERTEEMLAGLRLMLGNAAPVVAASEELAVDPEELRKLEALGYVQ